MNSIDYEQIKFVKRIASFATQGITECRLTHGSLDGSKTCEWMTLAFFKNPSSIPARMNIFPGEDADQEEIFDAYTLKFVQKIYAGLERKVTYKQFMTHQRSFGINKSGYVSVSDRFPLATLLNLVQVEELTA